MWALLVLLYGLLKGGRELVKKKAMGISTVMEVLVLYTAMSFVLVLPEAPRAGGLRPDQYAMLVVKSLMVFTAWMCSFHAVSKMPVSLFGVLDLSQVLFTTMLGAVVLHEVMHTGQVIGLILVCVGLFLLRFKPSKGEHSEPFDPKIALMAVAGCLFNGVSGTMDKVLMREMRSGQLQFWFMLFMLLMYLAYVAIMKVKIDWRSALKNRWIWILAGMFVIGDRSLFMANGMAGSSVTVMTLIKQSACVVTIVGGKLVFGEKNIGYKLLCAAVVVAGILTATLL